VVARFSASALHGAPTFTPNSNRLTLATHSPFYLRRTLLFHLPQPAFQFVQPFEEFEQQLDEVANRLFGGQLILAPALVEFMGSISGHRVAPFGMREEKKEKSFSANLPVRFRILLFGVPRLLADALHNMIAADTECTVVGKTTCPVEMSALLVAVQPSHLIADFDLPASFNFQLAEQIATAVTRIPIIVLTAHTKSDLLYQLLPLNFQALLTKDIEGQELIRILKLLKDGGGKRFCRQPLFIIWPTVKLQPPSLRHL